jgi:hypothetical protein
MDNFIEATFGDIDKTLVNGQVEWILPCNLEVGLNNNPRLPGEGLFCYLIRLIGGGIVGLTGPAGPAGANGSNGSNGFARTLANVAQPTLGAPNLVVTVDQPSLFPVGVVASAYVVGSGYYTVISKLGNQISMQLIVPVSPAPASIPAGSVIVIAGPRGATGSTGPAGAAGVAGPAGAAGSAGAAGAAGASGVATLTGPINMPAFGAAPVWATFSADLHGRPNMFVWLEDAGYLRVTAAAGVQLQLENMGEPGNAAGGTPILAGKVGAIAGPRGASTALADLTDQIGYKAPVVRVSTVHVGSVLGLGVPDDELYGDAIPVDGTVAADGDRVLLTAQTDPIFNGIWVARWGAYWDRASDFNEDAKCIPQSIVPVIGGTEYADTFWQLTTNSVILGTTSLVFEPIAGRGFHFRSSQQIGLHTPAVAAARLKIAGSDVTQSQINFVSGVAPASPAVGDFWHSSGQGAFVMVPGAAIQQYVNGTIFTATADVTRTDTGSLIPAGIGSMTLPAGFLKTGRTIRVWVRGYHTMDASAPTVNFRVRLGGVTVCETGAFTDSLNTDLFWEIAVDLTVRLAGSPGTVRGAGKFLMCESGGAADLRGMLGLTDVAVNTAIANLLDVDVVYGSADAGSPVTATLAVVQVLV